MKFLVVDANSGRFEDFQAKLVQAKLADASSIFHAVNMPEAFRLLEKPFVDFIFINCGTMRNSIAQIRQLRMAASSVPIVALISQRQEKRSDDFVRAGADDWLPYGDLNKSLILRAFRYVVSIRQVTQAKADLLADLSHEIRAPLHLILGTSDLLAETELSPPQKKLVQTFFNSSRRLLSILDTVFGLSRAGFNTNESLILTERSDIKEFTKLINRPFSQTKFLDWFEQLAPQETPGSEFEDKNLDILVVDDDLESHKLISAFMEKTKCKVSYAKDGYEALNLSKNKHFDLVLMDVEMPGLNGYETAQMLMPLQLSGKCKVLGLSANALMQDVMMAKKSGFAGYLTKPISKAALMSSITGCLKSDSFYEPIK
jgi:CheY-like chemotaxis protein